MSYSVIFIGTNHRDPNNLIRFHVRWRLFDKLGVVAVIYSRCGSLWKLQSGKFAFLFDLVLKRDERLRTKFFFFVCVHYAAVPE
jgi:hypothetical protein